VYRQLALENLEAVASERLGAQGQGLLPRHYASYRYCMADGRQFALGLVTEFFAGQGLHAALSTNLRALWPLLPASAGSAQSHGAALLAQLAEWRSFLDRFHATLAQQFAPGLPMPGFDLAAYSAQERARLARLQAYVLDDPLLPASAAGRVARVLAALGRRYFEDAGSEVLPASLCHGDLHLSHLLWRQQGGADQRCLIDLSPPALALDDPRLRCSSHLLDWAALERALDYFSLDEAALELAPHAGMSQEDTMHQLALARIDGQDAPQPNEAVALRLSALARWQAAVRKALCGARQPDRARERFYCARLLQELEYNYRYRRPYYRCMDLYCLAQHFLFLDGG
jgi:maltokinase